MHDGNAFLHIVAAIAVDGSPFTFRIRRTRNDIEFAGFEIKISFDIGKAVDSGNNQGRVFAETV